MTQYCSTAQFQRPRQQQQQQASSSPHATQRSKTPRCLYILRILVIISMSAMLTAGSAAGGTLTRNLAGGRYFITGACLSAAHHHELRPVRGADLSPGWVIDGEVTARGLGDLRGAVLCWIPARCPPLALPWPLVTPSLLWPVGGAGGGTLPP